MGKGQGPARRPQPDRREGPDEDWGEAEPLTLEQLRTRSRKGVGLMLFQPHPLTTEGARRGLGQRPKVLI